MWHIIECKSNTWGFMEISVEISKNYCQYIVLPPYSAPRGDLFSIPIYIISSIFTLLTVTHGRGLMCIKNNALLINKQHPINYHYLVEILHGPLSPPAKLGCLNWSRPLWQTVHEKIKTQNPFYKYNLRY